MPNHPMPRGERGLKKKGTIGRDKAKQWTDCIQCLSYRSVVLTISKKKVEIEPGKFEMRKAATGRCPECGYQTSISVMDEETYKIIEPVLKRESVLEEIIPPLSLEEEKKIQEEVDKVVFTPEY